MTQTQEQITEEVLYCTVHPDRETTLRCNKCGRPMCAKCAVLTPVGYRCKECVRGIQDNYYTASQADYAVIFGAVAALTAVAAGIVAAIGLPLLFSIILGLPVGGAIAEAGLRLTSRRRGRQSANLAAAGAVVGGLVGGVIQTLLVLGPVLSRVRVSVFDLLIQRMIGDLGLLVFIVIAAVAVYGRFKMRS
jgi:hypothetical protein